VSSRIPPALRGRGAKTLLVALPIGLTGSFVALPFTAQAAPSADTAISEVYGGGGNSGTSYTNDFIELGNAAGAPFDLSGWSVQYLPGSPTASSKWQVTPLTGTIPAGGTYLVQEAKGSGGDTALPTPDARRHRHHPHVGDQRHRGAGPLDRPAHLPDRS
jgi:hypothetical protein